LTIDNGVPDKQILKNAIKARAEVRAKELQRLTLKRRVGYRDEKDDEDEEMPDAARMKVS
jgi:hypothetical protein